MTKILKHEHLIIRAECKNPPKDETVIQQWILELIEKIDMKVLRGPISAYSDMVGNRGMTCGAIIETSHIVLHVWDEPDPSLFQLDVYSCSTVDPEKVFEHMKVFDVVKLEYKFLDREHGLVLV